MKMGLFLASLVLLSTQVFAQGSVKPFQVFDHELHLPSLDENKQDCATCHTFELDREKKTAKLVRNQENFFSNPMETVCHSCHRKLRTTQNDLFTCTLCHMDSAGIVPENHRVGWEKKHAYIKYPESDCMQCHQKSYCTDCHRRYEPNRPKMHSRNYRFFHSIEARMKPQSCYSCHRKSQCTDCHINGGPLR